MAALEEQITGREGSDAARDGPGIICRLLVMRKVLSNRFLWRPLVAALPLALAPLSQYLALAPWGSRFFLAIAEILVMSCGFVLFGILVGMVLVCRPTTRNEGCWILVCSFVYFAALATGIYWGQTIRNRTFRELTQRSQPLVAAIKHFETTHSRPPSALADLVPEFLAEVPQTDIGAYPDYRYELPTQLGQYERNPWALIVNTPFGFNFDIMLYLPKQNYPRSGYGGTLERIEDWAYVHE